MSSTTEKEGTTLNQAGKVDRKNWVKLIKQRLSASASVFFSPGSGNQKKSNPDDIDELDEQFEGSIEDPTRRFVEGTSPFSPLVGKLEQHREVPHHETGQLCASFNVTRNKLPKVIEDQNFYPLLYIVRRIEQINDAFIRHYFPEYLPDSDEHNKFPPEKLRELAKEAERDLLRCADTEAQSSALRIKANKAIFILLTALTPPKYSLKPPIQEMDFEQNNEFTLVARFPTFFAAEREILAAQLCYVCRLLNRTLDLRQAPPGQPVLGRSSSFIPESATQPTKKRHPVTQPRDGHNEPKKSRTSKRN
mmetsp:Transcript_3431/g.8148  ORF Transcript_3431/g.8148 Transcript_3431/m.8148 type:complete len:306 (-) Transcript_3431:232-1149(-)|eukprot:CAMPEP_0113505546 /NCGR_PEP_ID=MMETSP0014_2-20120614/35381_1 /TAXON_ID=2857 /ORGANISM="Nitzschia sp." /LENGTH=305 /DNA_ID=CAMNT_0000400879 /DNA_START=80 /DNA_END=997 /DNA_ORIENTATION=- /assembly_acc=CAM_ASM_000159